MTEPLSAEQRRRAQLGASMVKPLARVFARSWPKVSLDDFVSTGHEALVRAAARFDPSHGATLETFAYRAVWGAMMDLAHRETFIVQGTLRRLTSQALDPPGELGLDEWLDEDGPSGDLRDVLRGRVAALVALVALESPPPTPEESLIDVHERAHAMSALHRAMEGLSEREREVVDALYAQAMTLDQVASRLGVAKRTVQRLHDRIKARLAGELQAAPVVPTGVRA